MPSLDLLIALGLIGIIIVVFLISRIGILPKKSLPFVAGALAGIAGLVLWRERRARGLEKELEERENKIRGLERTLEESKERLGTSDRQLDKAKAELERQRNAIREEIADIREENIKDDERVDSLEGEKLHRETRGVLRGL